MDDSVDVGLVDCATDNSLHDAATHQARLRNYPPAHRQIAPRPTPEITPRSINTPIPSSGSVGVALHFLTPQPNQDLARSTPDKIEAPISEAENLQTPSDTARPPKRPRKSVIARPRQPTKLDALTPEKLKEQLIDLKLDALKLRAKVVYTNGQVDGTFIFPWDFSAEGPALRGKGFYVFDGFDRTWFIPENQSLPVPPSKQALLQDVNRRRQDMEKMYKSGEYRGLFNAAKALLKVEVAATCQSEWDEDENDSDAPAREWDDVKHQFNGSQLVHMIAKTRLFAGKALLLGYFRINLVELTLDGKIATRRVEIPHGLNFASFCERLDAWSPPNGPHDKAIIGALRKKLNIVLQHGSAEGKGKALRYLNDLNKPFWFHYLEDTRNERRVWNFKLFAKESYTIPPGKGPGKPGTSGRWMELKDDEAVKVMEDGVRAGRHPVVTRPWKIRLRRMWPNVDALEKYLAAGGEPELTEEQLETLDHLLAGQSEGQREHGIRLAAALKALGGPTYRPEFAHSAGQSYAFMDGTD